MEQEITKEVQEKLDKIDWKTLEQKYGISRKTVEQSPAIASQLVYGQMTDLVYASTPEMNAMFSLRAYPTQDGDWTVKLYSMEKPKTPADTLYLYNQPITSQRVKDALLERASWEDGDHNKRYGYANANGGRPISLEINGRKQDFLVSIHQPTNRVVGMPVDLVKSYLLDKDGHSKGKGIYGVKFTDEQAKALSEGNAVVISGTRKSGEKFTCCVQFDAAQRQVVACHPSWFKEAMKAGLDMSKTQEQAPKQEVQTGKGRKI